MKAAVGRRYGPPDVVTVSEMPAPRPRDDEILVRVRAATVGVVDGLARSGSPVYARAHFGLRRPRFPVLGAELAGGGEVGGRGVARFWGGGFEVGAVGPRVGVAGGATFLPRCGAL